MIRARKPRLMLTLLAAVILVLGAATAPAGAATRHGAIHKCCTGPSISRKVWKATGKGAKFDAFDAWHNCATFTRRSYSYSLGCSFSESVGNTVSGSVTVSDDVLSATVGYAVTRTKTVAANASFKIKKNTSGHIQYRQDYVGTPVHETRYLITKHADGSPTTKKKIGTATAYTYHWTGTEFQRT